MNDRWNVQRWETELSDLDGLEVMDLIDSNNALEINLRAGGASRAAQWRLRFVDFAAYTRALSTYHAAAIESPESDTELGNTLIVIGSQWPSEFAAPLLPLEVTYPDLQHYVIRTVDDIVEVLATVPPLVTSL